MGKFTDLTGQRFGRLVVIKKTKHRNISGNVMWECKCDCGKNTIVSTSSLNSGKTKSCGCLRLDIIRENHNNSDKNLTGKRFGKLIVMRRAMNDKYNNAKWICKCDCGNIVEVVRGSLINGLTMSCGCVKKEVTYEKWIESEPWNLTHYKGTNIISVSNNNTYKNNKSGTRGVSWDKEKQKWRAEITLRGKKYHLGYFDKDKLNHAIQARKIAEEELFRPIIEEYENLTKE